VLYGSRELKLAETAGKGKEGRTKLKERREFLADFMVVAYTKLYKK
jgi:hypothetical protein